MYKNCILKNKQNTLKQKAVTQGYDFHYKQVYLPYCLTNFSTTEPSSVIIFTKYKPDGCADRFNVV